MSKKAFKELGLSDDATEDQVKTRWRELAMQHHPDRGGDKEKFIALGDAYRACLAIARRPVLCDVCDGTGEETKQRGFTVTRLTCRACKGTGKRRRP